MAVLTDQQALAVQTIDRHVLVSAGAGSGKTHVLVERYIEFLRQVPGASASNIVAVTFTRKAASEMRTRLKARIKDLLLTSIGAEQERWQSAYREIDGARIGTIHSLCEMILKAFPVDAAIDPQIEVLDDLERVELQELSINQAFREVIAEQAPSHEFLLRYPIQDVRKWLAAAISSWARFTEALVQSELASEELWTAQVNRLIRRAQEQVLADLVSNPAWKDSLRTLELNPWKDPDSVLGQCQSDMIALAHRLDDGQSGAESPWTILSSVCDIKPRTNGGPSDEAVLIRHSIVALRSLAEPCLKAVPPELSEPDATAFSALQWFADLARRALAFYRKEKSGRLKLDFDDLIETAINTLSAKSSAARRFYNENIWAILVDEFQDTNRRQAELISLLAGPNTKLFLIGDDKQSIYKFQGADVATFNAWREKLSNKETASILGLTRSFRSHPSVVAFINGVFAQLMDEAKSGKAFEAKFEQLAAAREDSSDFERVQLILFDGTDPKGERRPRENEAVAVANWILDLIDAEAIVCNKSGSRPIRFGDFAVLVQRNRDFGHLERAFAAASIPYVTMGGKGYLERQEIHDLVNLLSFLSCPRDDHALVGVLRSPIFSVSDDLVHILGQARSSQKSKSLWQCMREIASQRKPGFEQLSACVSKLKIWIEDAHRLTVSELLAKVIMSTGYDLVLMSLPNGHQRSRNLWRLVWLAAEHETLSCSEFAGSISLMRDYNVKQADAPLDTGNAVKLMTIHNSKGLEFPAVALPVLNARFHNYTEKLFFHRDYGISLNTSRDSKDKPPSFLISRYLDQEMEKAEKKRLLYVAMTRARDYLALFSEREPSKTESFANWLAEILQYDSQPDAHLEARTVQHVANFKTQFVGVSELKGRQVRNSSPGSAANCPMKLDLVEPLLPQSDFSIASARRPARLTPIDSPPNIEPALVGTFFHALMEHLPADQLKPSQEMIQSLAFAQGDAVAHPLILKALIEDGERLLDIYCESELALKLRSARRILHEVPYMIFAADKQRTRRPDLLFEDSAGDWHLVDFKTDHFDPQAIEAQTNMHRTQLNEYLSDLRSITGIAAGAHLYFAQHGILHSVT